MIPIERRTFLLHLGTRAAAIGLMGAACASAARSSPAVAMYIGTYTRDGSRGIYRATLDARTRGIEVLGATDRIENPSFLAVDRARRRLYAVSEVGRFMGSDGGGVVAYAIERDGSLRELNRQPTHGGAPCHLSLAGSGRYLLVANYGGGNAAVFPVEVNGSLGSATQVVRHHGSGPNRQRQESPHAHWVGVDAADRHAFVVDLGIDRVVGYRFDAADGTLHPLEQGGVSSRPGAGPRHLAFHPDGRRAYVINELDSTLTALSYDPTAGSMVPLGTVSTLPADYQGENSCAEVVVDAGGRFVYASNRGHDSIAVFAIDPASDAPALVQHQATLGRTPRSFALDPSGRFLVAANQDSNSLVLFTVDPESGRLSPAGDPVAVPVPVCVLFT